MSQGSLTLYLMEGPPGPPDGVPVLAFLVVVGLFAALVFNLVFNDKEWGNVG